jgi:monoterpene epsilon-lactone hydrolase
VSEDEISSEVSDASRRIVADLWRLPASRGLSLAEWRYSAGSAERAPWPDELSAQEVDADGVQAEWAWRNDAETGGPIAFVLHGGGFIVCSIGTHRRLGAELAAVAGGRAFMVGYRLAPEAAFPAAIDDSVTAYRYLLDSGIDPASIWFFGDSAGGNLCLATCLQLRSAGLPLPAALVLASPLVDMTFSSASTEANKRFDPFSRIDDPQLMVDYYLAGADPQTPLSSPAFGDLSGLSPILTLVGTQEMLLDDARLLHDRATSAGVDSTLEVIDGAFHTWLGYAGSLPEADAAIRRIGEFVRSHL